MRKVRTFLAQLLATVIISIPAGCSAGDENALGRYIVEHMNKEKAGEVRQAIAEELRVGAEAQYIESFFERHGITYSYDRFNQSYNGIIRDVSPVFGQSILIHIYVDDHRRFIRAEVEDSFTAP